MRDRLFHGRLDLDPRLAWIEFEPQLLARLDVYIQVVDSRDLGGPLALAGGGIELPAADFRQVPHFLEQTFAVEQPPIGCRQLRGMLPHPLFQAEARLP